MHEGFAGETSTDASVREGWLPVLHGLKTLLETGRPMPAPVLSPTS